MWKADRAMRLGRLLVDSLFVILRSKMGGNGSQKSLILYTF